MSLVKGLTKIIKTESFKDGIVYQTNLFVPNTAPDSEIPIVGSLATWAPTTAYVTEIKRTPDSQHANYVITARDVSLVLEDNSTNGVRFKKYIFIDKDSFASLIPNIGDATTWTRLSSYLLSYQIISCGTSNYFVELVAVEDGYKVF